MAAIYESPDATPSHQKDLIEANAVYRQGDPDAFASTDETQKMRARFADGIGWGDAKGAEAQFLAALEGEPCYFWEIGRAHV